MSKFISLNLKSGQNIILNISDISYVQGSTVYLRSLEDAEAEYININKDLITRKIVLDNLSVAELTMFLLKA